MQMIAELKVLMDISEEFDVWCYNSLYNIIYNIYPIHWFIYFFILNGILFNKKDVAILHITLSITYNIIFSLWCISKTVSTPQTSLEVENVPFCKEKRNKRPFYYKKKKGAKDQTSRV